MSTILSDASTLPSDVRSQFATKVQELVRAYGKPAIEKAGSSGKTMFAKMTGLCIVAYVDFAGDGRPELLTVRYDGSAQSSLPGFGFGFETYVTEVWECGDGGVSLVHAGSVDGVNGGMLLRKVSVSKEGARLHEGPINSETSHPASGDHVVYGYAGGQFGPLLRYGCNAAGEFYFADEVGLDIKELNEHVVDYERGYEDVLLGWLTMNGASYDEAISRLQESEKAIKAAIEQLCGSI